ncbi:MAG TPA: hypothetical protein VHZ07_09030 [Bryobacteraceae bacterium]|jgi:hypothetical protein|nr:hypothetical protein [Bryobacteraceae bacterium]
MKKIFVAALGLSLLTGTALMAQDGGKMDSTSTSKKHKKSKKKSTMTSTSSAAG